MHLSTCTKQDDNEILHQLLCHGIPALGVTVENTAIIIASFTAQQGKTLALFISYARKLEKKFEDAGVSLRPMP